MNDPSKASAHRGVISGQTSAPGAKAVPLNPAERSLAGMSLAERNSDGRSHGVRRHGVKNLGGRKCGVIRPRVARFARVNGVRCAGGMASAAG